MSKSRFTSLCMSRCFALIFHNTTSADKAITSQLLCRFQYFYRIKGILHLKIVVYTSLPR